MKKLFKVAGDLPKRQRLIIELAGFIIIVFFWWLITHPFVSRKVELNVFNGVPPYSYQIYDTKDQLILKESGDKFKLPDDGTFTLKLIDAEKTESSVELNIKPENQGAKFENTSSAIGLQIIARLQYRLPMINKGILPAPGAVFSSFGELSKDKINVNLSSKYIISPDAIKSLEKDSISTSAINSLHKIENSQYSNVDDLHKGLQATLSASDFNKFNYDISKAVEVSSIMSVSSLLFNSMYSIFLNILGYIEAIFFSIVVGFIISLIPFFRGLLSRYIDAIRFVPLAAVTGLFIAWFGIELNMKVQFLAFGIFVFLLPVIVQRIDEVEKVYKQTAFTLGATDWQTIRYVYWPHVLSRILDDIRVLTAISWTYIIVAETVNKENGIGALIFTARRHSRLDQVFALLILIIIIGLIQDLAFARIDRKLNPHKY